MGRSITVFWDEGKLGSSVMLFYLLLFSLLSFPMSPTDSMPNWASCCFYSRMVSSEVKSNSIFMLILMRVPHQSILKSTYLNIFMRFLYSLSSLFKYSIGIPFSYAYIAKKKEIKYLFQDISLKNVELYKKKT